MSMLASLSWLETQPCKPFLIGNSCLQVFSLMEIYACKPFPDWNSCLQAFSWLETHACKPFPDWKPRLASLSWLEPMLWRYIGHSFTVNPNTYSGIYIAFVLGKLPRQAQVYAGAVWRLGTVVEGGECMYLILGCDFIIVVIIYLFIFLYLGPGWLH